MNKASRKVQATHLTLVLLNTLAASLIWGIGMMIFSRSLAKLAGVRSTVAGLGAEH